MSKERLAALDALEITYETLWGELPLDRVERMRACAENAGSASELLFGLLQVGDYLIRALALAADEPKETIFAGLREVFERSDD